MRSGRSSCEGARSAPRSRNLQPAAAAGVEPLPAAQQQIEGQELLIGQQHGWGEHDPSPAGLAGISDFQGHHDAEGFRTVQAALLMAKQHPAGLGEQIPAVDPIEPDGADTLPSGAPDLERRADDVSSRGGGA